MFRLSPRRQVSRSCTGSSLSTICETAPGDAETPKVSVSFGDIRAAAESRLRAPYNPATPRGIRANRRADATPDTPEASKWLARCAQSGEDDGREIWEEGSGTQVVKPQIQKTSIGLLQTSAGKSRAGELSAPSGRVRDLRAHPTKSPSLVAGQRAAVQRQGPSISCSSVSQPRSLQPPAAESPVRSHSFAGMSVSREPSSATEPRQGADAGSSGAGASAILEASVSIQQSFWDVLGMVKNATCCSGPPPQCVPIQCVPGQCVHDQCVQGRSGSEQCVPSRPAVTDRNRRRSVGEFVVIERSDFVVPSVPETDAFYPECWARAEEEAAIEGALHGSKEHAGSLHGNVLADSAGDDEVLLGASQGSPLRVLANELQKQLRHGGA